MNHAEATAEAAGMEASHGTYEYEEGGRSGGLARVVVTVAFEADPEPGEPAYVPATSNQWHPDPPTWRLRPRYVAKEGDGIGVQFTGRIRGFIGKSGLRFTCPEAGCERFIERGTCPIHGPGLRSAPLLKAKVLLEVTAIHAPDSPHEPPEVPRPQFCYNGLAPLLLWGQVLEAASAPEWRDRLTKTARDAMTANVTEDDVERALINRRVQAKGYIVPIDEHGYALTATEATFP